MPATVGFGLLGGDKRGTVVLMSAPLERPGPSPRPRDDSAPWSVAQEAPLATFSAAQLGEPVRLGSGCLVVVDWAGGFGVGGGRRSVPVTRRVGELVGLVGPVSAWVMTLLVVNKAWCC